MSAEDRADLVLALLEGAEFANALRRNGKPCRVGLPHDPGARRSLVHAHLRGAPKTLTFVAKRYAAWQERVEAVALTAFCPGADGRCRWLGIDLDAGDHGERGLADPTHAARCLAERAHCAGLGAGLLVARSRGGQGRNVFLLLPEPVSLWDALIGVAALSASAFKVAISDAAESEAPHAFRRVDGTIAGLGDPGSVELIPRSARKPEFGWALALPCAGAFAARGGSVLVDPFDDVPIEYDAVSRCDHAAWTCFLQEARATCPVRSHATGVHPTSKPARSPGMRAGAIDRIDHRTKAFLNGWVQEGTRNQAAFAASANLIGSGIDPCEAERLILSGARACGLPEREARSVFKSAASAVSRRGRQP